MSGPVELVFTPGGALVGVVHLVGDRGQMSVRVSAPDVQELVVLPGQVLVVVDRLDPGSWSVVDSPAPRRLKLPS